MSSWVVVNEKWWEFLQKDIVKPGVLIEVQHKDKTVEQFLIGDINKYGGLSLCMQSIDIDAIVMKYKTVWEKT